MNSEAPVSRIEALFATAHSSQQALTEDVRTALAEYEQGNLDRTQRIAIEEHFLKCIACSEYLIALNATAGLRPSTTGEAVPDDANLAERKKFQKLEFIGQGASGMVYKAYQTHLNRYVALKFLRPGVSIDEAKRQSQMPNHPGIVQVHDVLPAGEQQDLYFAAIVMEYIDGGKTLRTELKTLDKDQKIQIIRQIAAAVHHIHQTEILHLDLKPENILLKKETAGYRPKVTDFGISLTDLERKGCGQRAEGTWMYSAPEQLQGNVSEYCPATDVWSLGIMLYEALYGKRPYFGDNNQEVLKRIAEQAPPHFPKEPHYSRKLQRIISGCLQTKIQDRYQTAETLEQKLADYLQPSVAASLNRRTLLIGTGSVLLAYGATTVWNRRVAKSVTALPAQVGPKEDILFEVTEATKQPQGECLVAPGGTLTISGRGTLLMKSNCGILARGVIKIEGDPEQKIHLMCETPDKPWNGIAIVGEGANGSSMNHVIVSDGQGYLSFYPDKDPTNSTSQTTYLSPPINLETDKEKGDASKSIRRGGGLYMNNCQSINFNDVEFRNNSSRQGGAIFAYQVSGAGFHQCKFNANYATSDKKTGASPGGAIYVADVHDLVLENCHFTRNRAWGLPGCYSCGGAIYAGVNSNEIIIRSTNFEENLARHVGGAIYAFHNPKIDFANAPAVAVRLKECVFLNNFSGFWIKTDPKNPFRGGHHLFFDSGSQLTAHHTAFTNVTSPGPAIVAEAPSRPIYIDLANSIEIKNASQPSLRLPADAPPNKIITAGVQDTSPVPPPWPPKIQSMPLPKDCFKPRQSEQVIDTVVLHFASAVNWAKTNDQALNPETRQAILREFPELAKLTDKALAFDPRAVWAVFRAYQVGSHYMIGRDGTIFELIPPDQTAFHAGKSQMPEKWDAAKRMGVNDFSIGIELISCLPKDFPGMRQTAVPGVDDTKLESPSPYTLAQYASLIWLLPQISQQPNTQLRYVVGHDEIATGRKNDPGPWFEWESVRDATGAPVYVK